MGSAKICPIYFARDEWLQRPSLLPYVPSGQGLGLFCRSLRVDDAYLRPVGKKFRTMRLKWSSSTASAMSRCFELAITTTAYGVKAFVNFIFFGTPNLIVKGSQHKKRWLPDCGQKKGGPRRTRPKLSASRKSYSAATSGNSDIAVSRAP